MPRTAPAHHPLLSALTCSVGDDFFFFFFCGSDGRSKFTRDIADF